MTIRSLLCSLAAAGAMATLTAAPSVELPGDRMLADYFREETAAVQARSSIANVGLEEWTQQRMQYRAELLDMLGLSPLPERTPLKPTVTGTVEHEEFTVEKLHFQSQPGVYITANLYLPKPRPQKAPAVLYISGHSRVREGSVSFGSKVTYQHHGIWFARHGFVCLLVDSIGELAEIEGNHHGTQRDGFWWWNARGYTPAGAETWNAMRALDYLETRAEVDPQRIGVTGRSGGGVGSWWLAAVDERVKVAVPVAGMTDLHNQVVDGKVSRHCDCMFQVNTYRWDFAKIGALIAPRPLLFSNTDKDDIFPLDGVVRIHRDIARIYSLYGASDKLGLLITEGPHRDSQDLQVPAFRWMSRFLKGGDILVEKAPKKFFTPAQLKVFTTLPADEQNTRLPEQFVPKAAHVLPADAAGWAAQRDGWLRALREKCFAGWPSEGEPLRLQLRGRETKGDVTLSRWEFSSQGAVKLPLFVFSNGVKAAPELRLVVLDQQGWDELSAGAASPWLQEGSLAKAAPAAAAGVHAALLERVRRGEITLAYLPPRGIGPTVWSGKPADQLHIRRRFMLLGQTLEGMRVWDIRRAVEALALPQLFPGARVHLAGERFQAVNALYASLFARDVASVELLAPPASHETGPDYLSVLRIIDVPQAAVLAAERAPVSIRGAAGDWSWSLEGARRLGWSSHRLTIFP